MSITTSPLYTLLLGILVLWIAMAAGRKMLGWLSLSDLERLERAVFALALGLGLLAYGVFAIGLLGWLNTWAFAAWLALVGFIGWREHLPMIKEVPALWTDLSTGWGKINWGNRSVWMILGLLLILTLLQALAPPWDVDGLIYHLQGPRQFLEAGRIQPVGENWLTFYPFTIQMLFTLGLGLGSDSFSRLIHLGYAVLLVLATYTAGRRILNLNAGRLAALILIAIPIFPLWASAAYIDMGWALYEFLALYALLIWSQKKQARWLALAGIFAGLALGTKYMALGSTAVLGLLIVWWSRDKGWAGVFKQGMIFGGVALLVGSPWYLKNWLWTGNPLYPLLFGAGDWPARRIELWTAYMHSFGAGHRLVDYLLLPVNLYLQHERFGTFLGSIEIPSFLFLAVFFLPWVKRSSQVNALAVFALLRFAVWAAGSQQTRFLLPLFPVLSLLAAWVLLSLSQRMRRMSLVTTGLIAGLLVVTLIYSFLFFVSVQPLGVLVGAETKGAFLTRNVHDYAALQYIRENLPLEARVLMMWDGQGYYCDQRCLPDIDHAQWTYLVGQAGSVEAIAEELHKRGVTHLLFSISDTDFMLQHDPGGEHQKAASLFFDEFKPACMKEVYRDDLAVAYKLTCRQVE